MFDPATLDSLEFPHICDLLAHMCQSHRAQQQAQALSPSTDKHQIRFQLDEVKEYLEFRAQKGTVSFEKVVDCEAIFKKIAQPGFILTPTEICEVRNMLQVSHEIRELFRDIQADYPLLMAKVKALQSCPALEKMIAQTIGAEGDIRDHASPELRKIRQKIYKNREKIYKNLEQFMARAEVAPSIQDRVITNRNQRFVIPVKAENKTRIEGIIHDQSASGATLFIEPLCILPLNNTLIQDRLAEQTEIKRILRSITAQCRENLPVIEQNYTRVTDLDLVQGKAFLALKFEAQQPEIVDSIGLDIRQARHPLLIHYLGKHEVVPTTITVSEHNRILLISGPNMGGKTVTLKTAGLLALMVQSGLFVPAAADSKFPVFESLFTDIGDRQDIAQSLSTFAAHLLRIKDILDQAGPSSLVLLDELGTGTDPDEGGALGQMILDEMFSRKALTIATTHLTQLKQKTMQKSESMVASVQFDPLTLRPTFVLKYGQYGDSNAFAIAQNLGIQPSYIQKAQYYLNPMQKQLTQMIETVERKQAELEDREKQLERKRRKLQARKKDIEKKGRQNLKRSYQESQKLLAQVRERIRYLHQELSAPQKQSRILDKIQSEVKQLEEEITDIFSPVVKPAVQPVSKAVTFRQGDRVRLQDVGKTGEIVSVSAEKKTAQINIGGLRLNVPWTQLELSHQENKPPASETIVSLERETEAAVTPLRLYLLGERVDEGLRKLDKYLDDAILASLPQVTIVHGIGEEKLRPAVLTLLKKHPQVNKFRPGDDFEGGAGVTVVDLSS